MIDHELIFPDVADCFCELLEINRFDNVTVGAHLVGPHDVPLLAGGCEHDDWNPARARIVPDALKNFVTIQSRQFQVQQDELRPFRNFFVGTRRVAEQEVQGFHAVARDVNRICQVGSLEGMPRELDVVGVVFDQQDFRAFVRRDQQPPL
jgi:hypothetical protein